jgi:hypothetical protein
MFIVRSTETGGTFLATDRGLIHLQTAEEVNVAGWLLDDARAANATLNQGGRFMQVLQGILARPVYVTTVRKTAGRESTAEILRDLLDTAPPPEPSDDPDAVEPPPGMDLYLPDAPGHDPIPEPR